MNQLDNNNLETNSTYMTLVVLYVLSLALALTVAKKLVILPFGMSASAGTILGYASCFIITDIISEVYGYHAARRAVRYGILSFIVFIGMVNVSLLLPISTVWIPQESFDDVLYLSPRLILGAFIAYWLSQRVDVWIYHKIKHATQGRMLWLRNNLSTMTAQLVDSIVWPTIAFAGIMSISEVLSLIQGEYIVKLCVALIDTIVLYGVVKFVVKRKFNKN